MGPNVPGVKRLVLPTPYAVGPVNVYLILGEEPALVDVGPATPEAVEALMSQLREAGLRPADVRRVVVTHAHPDHFGALALLHRETGWEVAAHPRAVLWTADGQDILEARVSFYLSFLRHCGVPAELMRVLERDALGLRRYPRGVPIHRFLQEGDTVRAGDHQLRVYHTPGHASSAICLLRSDGVLFSGDTLLGHISSNALVEPAGSWRNARRRSLPEYLATLTRLRDWPVALVLPGHGDEIYDHRRLIGDRLRFYRQRRDTIMGMLEAGPITVYGLCTALFPGLPVNQLFLGLSETIGYLDLLEEEGLLEARAENGVTLYRSMRRTSVR